MCIYLYKELPSGFPKGLQYFAIPPEINESFLLLHILASTRCCQSFLILTILEGERRGGISLSILPKVTKVVSIGNGPQTQATWLLLWGLNTTFDNPCSTDKSFSVSKTRPRSCFLGAYHQTGEIDIYVMTIQIENYNYKNT